MLVAQAKTGSSSSIGLKKKKGKINKQDNVCNTGAPTYKFKCSTQVVSYVHTYTYDAQHYVKYNITP